MDLNRLVWIWLGVTGLWTFALFGFDKSRARSGKSRIAESTLAWSSALGGWPGGLLGILVFSHKSSKPSFLLKFAVAFVVWTALMYAAWRYAGLTLR